jgi:hypothetical protein
MDTNFRITKATTVGQIIDMLKKEEAGIFFNMDDDDKTINDTCDGILSGIEFCSDDKNNIKIVVENQDGDWYEGFFLTKDCPSIIAITDEKPVAAKKTTKKKN